MAALLTFFRVADFRAAEFYILIVEVDRVSGRSDALFGVHLAEQRSSGAQYSFARSRKTRVVARVNDAPLFDPCSLDEGACIAVEQLEGRTFVIF